MKLRFSIALISAALLTAAVQAADTQRLDEPELKNWTISEPPHADQQIVDMLAGLLKDSDPSVREQAIQALGDCNNNLSLVPMQTAAEDSALSVRRGVVMAAANYRQAAAVEIIKKALKASESELVLAGLDSIRRQNDAGYAGDVAALLSSKDPLVVSVALQTLSDLKTAAQAQELASLMKSASATVRLRAAENALLLSSAGDTAAVLAELASQDPVAAVRGAAVAALGKLTFTDSQATIASAIKDESPLVRRGAVKAYAFAGQMTPIRPLIDQKNEPAAMVRLVAAEAAGTLKDAQSVDMLVYWLENAGDIQMHQAARTSLLQIKTPQVAAGVAGVSQRTLAYIAGEKKKKTSKQTELALRNASSCALVLGEMKSTEGLQSQIDTMMWFINDYAGITNPVISDIARSFGKINDKRTVAPMMESLKKLQARALEFFAAVLAGSNDPPPYNDTVTATVIMALGDMKAAEASQIVYSVARTQKSNMHTGVAASAATIALPKMGGIDEATLKQLAMDMLTKPEFGSVAKYYGGKAAAKLKIKEAESHLNTILEKDRPGMDMMLGAAWSLQELTGKTPSIPETRVLQGDWILVKKQ